MAKTEIKVKFKIQETNSEIQRLILEELKKVFEEVFRKSINSIETQTRNLFYNAIESDTTWQSLKSGKLKAHFGLPDDAAKRLEEIVQIWLKEITIDPNPVVVKSSTVRGGFKLNMLENDWINVISAQDASIITAVGQVLPWLEWLLIEGDKIIIRDFEVVMKPAPQSRSGMAIMIKKKSGRWRVPPEFAGTTNNNFVTKLLENLDSDIEQIIETEIVNRL
jgi:hypothetical protein